MEYAINKLKHELTVIGTRIINAEEAEKELISCKEDIVKLKNIKSELQKAIIALGGEPGKV